MDDLSEMIRAELKRISDDVGKGLGASKERDAEMAKKQQEIQARVRELEQLAARRGEPYAEMGVHGDGGMQALRDILEASDDLKLMADGRKRKRAVFDMPPGFFQAAIVSTGGLALPDRQDGLVAPVKRRFTVRGLLPSIRTTSGSVQYTQETAFDNQAAPVAEAAAKPESGITFTMKTAAVQVLAHWIKASVQVLDDTPTLMEYIANRLRYGLAFVEDLQLLKGSGVGVNIEGLLVNPTAYNRTTAGDTKIDILRRAISQLEDTDYSATGIVLHPFDWEKIALTKDTTGQYIAGSPGGANPPTLWNLPVVSTSAMTANDFCVADFSQAAVVLDRQDATVEASTEDEDNFKKNMVTIRGEERLGLMKVRPGAVIKGTFP